MNCYSIIHEIIINKYSTNYLYQFQNQTANTNNQLKQLMLNNTTTSQGLQLVMDPRMVILQTVSPQQGKNL